jgi:hypothetical protein
MKNPHILTQAILSVLTVAVIYLGYQVGHLAAPAANVIPSPPAPVAAADGVALGRSYAPVLASTYGDGWTAAADSLEKGGAVGDAQKALQDTWRDARERAFAARVTPAFARVLPEGAEPSTPEKRAEVVKLWRDFARGLKGGK